MGLKALITMLAALMGLLLASPVWAEGPTLDEIAQELVCQCGCNMVLNNCTHGDCMVRDSMRTAIGQMIAQGQGKDEIIQAFVAQYGEKVLAAPTKQGFNLTAWITPFAVLIAGLLAVFLLIQAWLHSGKASAQAPALTEEVDEEYRSRLEQELESFPERGQL